MKRILYLATSVALLTSMVVAGSALAARHNSAPAKKTINFSFCTSGPVSYSGYTVLWEGVQNAVQIAINQYKGKLAKVGVHVSYPTALHLDNGDPSQPGGYSTTKENTNAQTCLGVTNTIAYIGTLNSGATLVSEPILNKAHMPMISPANTNPDLTSPVPLNGVGGRHAQEPLTFNHTLKYVTFYRTVTTDKLQGPAGALFAHNILHQKNFYLLDDGTLYGEGLATFFAKEAKKLGMKEKGFSRFSGGGANASAIAQDVSNAKPSMVYCGCNPPVSPIIVDLRTQHGFTGAWMGGDALENPAWLSAGEAGPRGGKNNDVTLTGPAVQKTGKFFINLEKRYFRSFYNKNGTQPYDASAYDAAGVALTAIWEAAKAHKLVAATNGGRIIKDRNTILPKIAHIKFKGATGTTSFDKNGDTTNKIISIYASKTVKGVLTWVFKTQLVAKGSPV
jgi:branched-chain amino acid transport system substrate-binding protein